MTTQLTLTDKQKQLLQDLTEILEFGYTELSKRSYPLKLRPRKTILISMMAAMQNYAEGILCLLKEGRTNSAELVVRSMVESFINLAYIYVGRNERNAVIFLLDDVHDRKRLGERIKKFLTDFPSYKTSFDSMKTPEEWDNFIAERLKEISQIGKKYPYTLTQLPDLRQRAQAHDRIQERKHKRELKTRLEWWYLTMYWYFSTLSHLGIRGLNTFFDVQNGQVYINASGRPEDMERIIVASYSIYYQFLRTFAKQFNLFDLKLLEKYKNTFLSYGQDETV